MLAKFGISDVINSIAIGHVYCSIAIGHVYCSIDIPTGAWETYALEYIKSII